MHRDYNENNYEKKKKENSSTFAMDPLKMGFYFGEAKQQLVNEQKSKMRWLQYS